MIDLDKLRAYLPADIRADMAAGMVLAVGIIRSTVPTAEVSTSDPAWVRAVDEAVEDIDTAVYGAAEILAPGALGRLSSILADMADGGEYVDEDRLWCDRCDDTAADPS